MVGAGLAGLAAAIDLRGAGHEARIPEARDRPGGRALTLRGAKQGGLPVEAGPARFRDDHRLVMSYLGRFGLEYSPFYPRNGAIIAVAGGERVFHGPIGSNRGWLVAGSRRETATSWLRAYGEIAPQFGVGLEPRPWHRPSLYRIRGGTDLLPRALAEKMRTSIEYNTPVLAIAQSAGRVSITTAGPSGNQTRDFDHAICAAPVPALARIAFSPALSFAKTEALGRLRFESASRVFLHVRQRRWRSQGLCGFGAADDLGEIWDTTFDREGKHATLTIYAKGPLARRMFEASPATRLATAVARIGSVLPGIADDVEDGDSFCWDGEEWSWGGWPVLRNHAARQGRYGTLEALRTPEGRVHFAGDHTALRWLAWMEGALESGHRAAREVRSATVDHLGR